MMNLTRAMRCLFRPHDWERVSVKRGEYLSYQIVGWRCKRCGVTWYNSHTLITPDQKVWTEE